MQVQGSPPSCRFAESNAHLAHEVLFVRDAVGLVVPPAAGLPPALEGSLPDLRDVVDETQRREAGRQWADWWNAVVTLEMADHGIPARP